MPSVDRRSVLLALTSVSLVGPAAAVGVAHPPRVAVLDWAIAETMIALRYNPVALVAASDWNRFVVEPALPPGIADIGLQQQVNFELLAQLRPDLILTSPFSQENEPVLRRIAPTERLSVFEPSAIPLGTARALMRTLGDRLGRSDAAARFLQAADAQLDAYRERVRALRPLPVLLINFEDARHARVYGGAGLFQNVLDRIGVRNAWTGATNYWGFATVGIERLATDRDVSLMVFEPVPADVRPTLSQSPLWLDLPFVRAGRVSRLPPVLMFGALPAALRFARILVQTLERSPA